MQKMFVKFNCYWELLTVENVETVETQFNINSYQLKLPKLMFFLHFFVLKFLNIHW